MMRRSVAAAFSLLAATAAAEVPLELYGRLPTVPDMSISPDGGRVAFRRTTETSDGVIVLERDTGNMIGGLDGSKTILRGLSFLDQERLYLYAAESQHAASLRRKLQISSSFIFDVEANRLETLLYRSRHLYPRQTGVGRIVGHDPERDSVFMPAWIDRGPGRPPTYGLLEVTMDDPDGRVLERGGEDTVDWFVDQQGRVLAEVEFDEKDEVQRILGRDDDGDAVLLHDSGGLQEAYTAVGLSRDLRALVVSARILGTEFNTYFEMDLDDGEVGAPLFERDDASVERPLIDAGRRVFGVEYSGFFPRYEFYDSALTKRVREIQTYVAPAAAYLVDWSPDFRFLLFRLTGGWTAGTWVIAEPDSPQPRLLTHMREDFPADAVVPTMVVRYEARDGLQIPALLTARADVHNRGNAPLIVLPHGGPEAYDRYGFDWLVQYFASRGIVVLQPQFRGSSGFGDTLRRAGQGQWGGAMSTDLDDGAQYLVDEGLVDPGRVCMVGVSYGGYAALAAGAFSPFDYRCFVAVNGVSDLRRMLRDQRKKYGSDSREVNYWQDQFGIGDQTDRVLDDVSPAYFADKFRAPVLLVHGRDDAIVPLDQSVRMDKALRRADKQVEFERLKGEDHFLSRYESRLAALRIMAAFVDTHL